MNRPCVTDGSYLMDTGWACGLVVVKDGVITDCAPIFRKRFLNKSWTTLIHYKLWQLNIAE